MHDDVIETLRTAQRFGFFGSRPIDDAIAHSHQYVTALGVLGTGTRLIDIGSGGGLPGLVVADAYPMVDVTLLDRREKRTDFLHQAVGRLGWTHVTVVCADVDDVIAEVGSGACQPFDVVTARGFGPPDVTLRSARNLLTSDGRIVISEPPSANRWPAALLEDLRVARHQVGGVSVFTPSG
ncbi:MAG: RsmG family class I SAM-dependent methyltransferase [Ilumatobacteraceae bacterium]